jgi:hypothetical protein
VLEFRSFAAPQTGVVGKYSGGYWQAATINGVPLASYALIKP